MVNDAPSPRREVVVGCPGHQRAMTIINDRFLKWRCTQKRCRHPDDPTGKNYRVFHIADSLTGCLVRTEYEVHEGRVIRPEGE